MTEFPSRSRDYVGPITDTRIWDGFDLRPDDVILSSPPKCGTTWSQAIIMMLLHSRTEGGRAVWRDSLWLDCGFRDQADLKARLDAQTHRRCIKSHTPMDGIPFDPSVTYITVYRHPVDVHFSMEKHVSNMISDVLDFMYPEEEGAAFDRFLTAPATDGGTDDLTLASFLQHYHSFRKWAHMPNVHFFHYADLKRDPRGTIEKYARAMSLHPDDDLLDDIVAHTNFETMKEVTRQQPRDKGVGAFTDETKFFDSATNRKWQGRLSDAEYARYQTLFQSMATAENINWLENGTLPKAS